MQYVTEIHALNLPCALDTCGDWHTSAIQWSRPHLRESAESLFGDYGIERGRKIPEHEGVYNIANHIRALLDLVEAEKLGIAGGMRSDFICNERYTDEIFSKILMMKSLPHWNKIDTFMAKEYYMRWIRFKEGKL